MEPEYEALLKKILDDPNNRWNKENIKIHHFEKINQTIAIVGYKAEKTIVTPLDEGNRELYKKPSENVIITLLDEGGQNVLQATIAVTIIVRDNIFTAGTNVTILPI